MAPYTLKPYTSTRVNPDVVNKPHVVSVVVRVLMHVAYINNIVFRVI